MNLTATTHEAAGVTFVSLLVSNDSAEPRRFRVANRLDGPVWPPRVHGVVAAGWDEAGYEGVVAGGGTRALGYASSAPSVSPPAELVWQEPAGESEPEGQSAAALRRRFGDPRPPADVVIPTYLATDRNRDDDVGDRR
jgi:hypothetical protein